MSKKLLLIDGNSLINRAYYAFMGGTNNATYGFLNMFFRAVTDLSPTHVAVAFDVRAKTFRHKMYDGYKATRKSMPDDLAVQLGDLKKLLGVMQIAIVEKEGYEADDIIGTIAGTTPSIILTADKDAMQLIDQSTELFLTKTGVTNLDIWTTDRIQTEYGINPQDLIQVKALMGDKSDNIPGADGVGEKTALDLIQKYQTIENVYENLQNIKGALHEKLLKSKDNVFLSRELAKINCDVSLDLPDMTFKFPLGNEVFEEFTKRDFNSFLKREYLWKEQQSETKIETIEIKSFDEIKLNDFATITREHDAYYINEYKIPIMRDLLSGGFTPEQISDFTGKIQTQKMTWDDIKLIEHLVHGKVNSEPRRVPPAEIKKTYQKLKDDGMFVLYKDVEVPLTNILQSMTKNGLKINLEKLSNKSDELKSQIEQITKKIYEISGSNFNINSPQQLGDVLFNKLGIATTKKTKTGYSTDEHELTKIKDKHPLISEILKYRKVHKIYSTYIQSYKNLERDGFLHPKYNNTGTVTGRLASNEPNIQNIPEEVRALFTSRYGGGKLICADYNQIELRLLAHFSDCPVLKDIYTNGLDIHNETARALGVDRRTAKAVNFGVVYGISAFGLSENIGCSVSDAGKFIEKYFERFPAVKKYLDSVKDEAIANGYVSTLMGRRRYLPELQSGKQNLIQFGLRAATNMPMQGSASDIIKKAMVELVSKLPKDCLMIAQIHDELVLDCSPEQVDYIVPLIKETMESAVSINVPLLVDVKIKESL